MGLLAGQNHDELAGQLGITSGEVLTRAMSDPVREAERRLRHIHKMGVAASQSMMLDALPEFIQRLCEVACDPSHKAWAVAAKLYVDRVIPVTQATHHVHEVGMDPETRAAMVTASSNLERLVNQLGPKVLEMQAVDVSSRVLRGEAAKPQTVMLPMGESERAS